MGSKKFRGSHNQKMLIGGSTLDMKSIPNRERLINQKVKDEPVGTIAFYIGRILNQHSLNCVDGFWLMRSH